MGTLTKRRMNMLLVMVGNFDLSLRPDERA